MKIHSFKFKIVLVLGVATILAIFITKPAVSQKNTEKESHKKITLKIVSDDNGKTTMIDTTMEMPDSTMIDSMKQEIEKVIELGRSDKHCQFKMQKMPDGFNYKFDMPCPPECPMDLEDFGDFEWEGNEPGRGEMNENMMERMAPGMERRVLRSGGQGQTLNDMLGEIPMDRVVSYSIKDRKGGKRIVIDLNDAPMFEKQDRVIVIREPGRMQHKKNGHERQVKVYVNTNDDEKSGNMPEPPEPPAAPPPPPAKKSK